MDRCQVEIVCDFYNTLLANLKKSIDLSTDNKQLFLYKYLCKFCVCSESNV